MRMKHVDDEDYDVGSGTGLFIGGLVVILFEQIVTKNGMIPGFILITMGLLYWLKSLYKLNKFKSTVSTGGKDD